MEFFKNYKSSFILIFSIVIGCIAGSIFGESAKIVEPIANLFLNLIFCLVPPMIFVSLVSSIANAKGDAKLGKIIVVLVTVFIISELIAALSMLGTIQFVELAKTYTFTQKGEISNTSINFLSIFSVGNFYELFARGNLMAMVVFSILFGTTLLKHKERARNVIIFFDEISDIVVKMIIFIMKFAPIGLGCFFAVLVSENKELVSVDLSKALALYFIVAFFYFFISNTVFAYLAGGISGVKKLYKYIINSALIALGTCSSAAAVPSNLIACKNIRINDEISNLTIPLGCNLHKPGTVMAAIVKIAFMCSVFNVDLFTIENLIKAIFVAIMIGSVVGPIPTGGYVSEMLVASTFGFPPEAIPVLVLIGTVTDCAQTTISATNDVGAAMLVDKIVNKVKF